MNFNKAIIAGRITRDPEVRTTKSGTQVASFSVATNSYFKDKAGEKKESVEFHNVVAWGKAAEIAGTYCKKGQLVIVEGRLQTRSWEDKNQVKRYATEIVSSNIQFGPKPAGAATAKPAEKAGDGEQPEPTNGEPEINVEDIPF